MNYIKVTKEDFEKWTPSAIDAESFVFEDLENYFKDAYNNLSNKLLGRELANELPTILQEKNGTSEVDVEDNENPEDNDNTDGVEEDEKEEIISDGYFVAGKSLDEINDIVKKYIILEGFRKAIPNLDLILTNNGFGIVNTENIAPASKERVERLINQCEIERDNAFDNLVIALPGNNKTRKLILKSNSFLLRTNSFIWTSSMIDEYTNEGNNLEGHARLNKILPHIHMAESLMKSKISLKMWQEVIEYLRDTNQDNEPIYILVLLMKAWLSELLMNDNVHCPTQHEGRVLTYLDNNVEFFTSWSLSEEYKARHMEGYKNGSKDKCFFF